MRASRSSASSANSTAATEAEHDGPASSTMRHRPQTGAKIERRWEHWNAEEHAATGNWLVRDEVQRRQLLELNRALREKAKAAFLIGFALGGLSAIQYGWQILVPPTIMGDDLCPHRAPHRALPPSRIRPRTGWIGAPDLVRRLRACSRTRRCSSPFPLLLVLVIGSSAVFPPRGVVVGRRARRRASCSRGSRASASTCAARARSAGRARLRPRAC